jgi:membrane protein DedA with SNARE-associated domain
MVHLTPSLELLTDTYYFVLFPLMIIEGPAVMIIAGFLVSLGYYELRDVFVTAVIAALIGDFLHYAAGRWGRNAPSSCLRSTRAKP